MLLIHAFESANLQERDALLGVERLHRFIDSAVRTLLLRRRVISTLSLANTNVFNDGAAGGGGDGCGGGCAGGCGGVRLRPTPVVAAIRSDGALSSFALVKLAGSKRMRCRGTAL